MTSKDRQQKRYSQRTKNNILWLQLEILYQFTCLEFMTVLTKERWLVWPEAFRDEEAITFAVNTKTSIKIQRWLPSLPPSARETSLNVVFFTWKTDRKYGTDHSCMVQWKQNLSCQLYFCVKFYGPSGLYIYNDGRPFGLMTLKVITMHVYLLKYSTLLQLS